MPRDDKNKPQEVSSKRPVSVIRENNPKKPRFHDPRFDRAMGAYNEDLFKKSFEFIGELKQKERKQLETAVEKEKDPLRKDKLKMLLQRQRSTEEQMKKEEKRKQILRDRKKVETELVAQGKKPYYLKKTEVKNLELAERYKDLKAKAQDGLVDIDKIVEKKRKHKASKQHKFMPMQ